MFHSLKFGEAISYILTSHYKLYQPCYYLLKTDEIYDKIKPHIVLQLNELL